MKKKILIGTAFLMVMLLLTGCGGVSQEEYDDAVADKSAAEAQVTSLQSQLSTAQSDLAAAESAQAAAEADLATAKNSLLTAQGDLSDALADVTSLEAQVTALEAEVASLEAQVAALEAGGGGEEEEEEEEEETGGFTGTTYTNSEYGFSVTYPSTWEEKDAGSLTAGLSKHFGVSATYYLPGVYYLTVDESSAATLEDAYNAFVAGAGYTVGSFTGTTVTIDGVECTKAEIMYVHAYGDIDGTWVGFKKSGKWVIIGVVQFPALGGSWENATQENDIVNTITISS